MDNNVEKATIERVIESHKLVTIFMINGFQMIGLIVDYDDVSVIVNVAGKRRLLYKQNISTIDFE